MREPERRVGLREIRRERDGLARRRLRFREHIARRREVGVSNLRVRVSKAGVRGGIGRVRVKRAAEFVDWRRTSP